MCLIHNSAANKARLCVNEMPFIYAPIVADENTYQGMLGLARGSKNSINYVKLLYMQGIISKPIVSLNFEDPMDKHQISQVGFGEILYDEIEYGENGINVYSNLGRN